MDKVILEQVREYKSVKFSQFTMDDDAGKFDGYLNVFNVRDSHDDVSLPGCFKKTLKEKKIFPLLWSHYPTDVLGAFTGIEDEKGLKIHGDLNMEVQAAREKRSLIKQGAVNGLSIGFQAVKYKKDEKENVRYLQEVNLWEGSLVVFPANDKSLVQNIKSASDIQDALDNILLMDLKSISSGQREMAVKAIERIWALLGNAEPLKSTRLLREPPDLKDLLAEVRKCRENLNKE